MTSTVRHGWESTNLPNRDHPNRDHPNRDQQKRHKSRVAAKGRSCCMQWLYRNPLRALAFSLPCVAWL